jgi:hypothetical protein
VAGVRATMKEKKLVAERFLIVREPHEKDEADRT